MSNDDTNHTADEPKFDVGLVITTSGIRADFIDKEGGREFLTECVDRHRTGDWGALDPHDLAMNDEAASNEAIDAGLRVLSAYPVPEHLRADRHPGLRIWVITSNEAWDETETVRATTILWPTEY